MVNPDSDLARTHPEWVMAAGGAAANAVPPPAGARSRQRRGLRLCPGATRRHPRRIPDRLSQVGPQPRPPGRRPPSGWRGGCACPDRGALSTDGRPESAPPRTRDRVLLLRRRPGRPRCDGPGRPDLGERHERRAGTATDTTVDRAAAPAGAGRLPRRPSPLAHDRAHPGPVLPGGHRILRPPRHRVGHLRGHRAGPCRDGAVGGAAQAIPRPAAQRQGGARRPSGPGSVGPRGRRTGAVKKRSLPSSRSGSGSGPGRDGFGCQACSTPPPTGSACCHPPTRRRPTTPAPRRGCPLSRWNSRAACSRAWVSRSRACTPSSCCCCTWSPWADRVSAWRRKCGREVTNGLRSSCERVRPSLTTLHSDRPARTCR